MGEYKYPGLRLSAAQERSLRAWPTERIRPKSVALGVMSLLAEIDVLRTDLAKREQISHAEFSRFVQEAQEQRERAESLVNALEHIETITAPEMEPLYNVRPMPSAAVSAHKIAKCAVAADRETLAGRTLPQETSEIP